MLSVQLTRQARKFLARMHPKHRRQVAGKIQELQNDPLPNDHKPLKGYQGILRTDVGEYRIIYRVDEAEAILLVMIIGKRNDDEAYRILVRQMR